LAVVMVFSTSARHAAAQEPQAPKRTFSQHSLLTASTKAVGTVDTKFSALTLVEEQIEKNGQYLEGPPVACFGIRKLGDKLTYTYFVVFRGKPEPKRLKVAFDVPSGVGGHNADVKPFIEVGERKIPIEYKFEADPKTGTILKEALKVDGKDYDKAGPRVFLIDLTEPKIVVRPPQAKLPDSVPDGHDDKDLSLKVTRALQQLEDKSPQLRIFLEPDPPFGSASIQTQGTSRGSAGEGFYGMSAASLLIVHGRPVAAFGIRQAPKEAEKYSYFILFKSNPPDPKKPLRFAYPGEGSNAGGILLTRAEPMVLFGEERKWGYEYLFKAKQRPYQLLSETLRIDGKEYKTSENRVFLVDLTQAKPSCRPLKIAPPEIVPELKDGTFTTAVQRAVRQLRMDSAEVREFLAAAVKE
jgi:hypothetical protein